MTSVEQVNILNMEKGCRSDYADAMLPQLGATRVDAYKLALTDHVATKIAQVQAGAAIDLWSGWPAL